MFSGAHGEGVFEVCYIGISIVLCRGVMRIFVSRDFTCVTKSLLPPSNGPTHQHVEQAVTDIINHEEDILCMFPCFSGLLL